MIRRYEQDDLDRVAGVLATGRLGQLPDGHVRALGREFADVVGARHGIPRNSNLTALSQVLMLAGAASAEVICDPLVQYGAVAALSVGATPVFVDVRADTYNLDERLLDAALSDRTRAVVVTHLWGQCADMPAIVETCRGREVLVVEDCAHSVGSTWADQHSGTFGDVGVFSFNQHKQISTGDGGLVVTDHDWIHEQLTNEWPSGESPGFLTLNYRMTEVVAALGIGQLRRVPEYLRAYDSARHELDTMLGEVPWLRHRTTPEAAVRSPYWWAALWTGDHNSFTDFAQQVDRLGTEAGCRFTRKPAPEYPIFASAQVAGGTLPVAQAILERVVHIPLVELGVSEAAALATAIRAIGEQTWQPPS